MWEFAFSVVSGEHINSSQIMDVLFRIFFN